MDSKFFVFGILSAVLLTGIYSIVGVTNINAAGISTVCSGIDKKTQMCTTYDSDSQETIKWKCTTSNAGKTWKCVKAEAGAKDTIPPELSEALDTAIGEDKASPKVPDTNAENGGTLSGEGSSNGNGTNPKDLGNSLTPDLFS